jgi:hypothetical protein
MQRTLINSTTSFNLQTHGSVKLRNIRKLKGASVKTILKQGKKECWDVSIDLIYIYEFISSLLHHIKSLISPSISEKLVVTKFPSERSSAWIALGDQSRGKEKKKN